MLSRWPVLVEVDVAPDDVDADGILTLEGVERVVAVARDAYLDRCTTIDAVSVVQRRVTPGPDPATDRVSVSANVVEVYPETLTMAARVRPAVGDAVAATASLSLSPGGEVTTAMRDELIALAHSAKYLH